MGFFLVSLFWTQLLPKTPWWKRFGHDHEDNSGGRRDVCQPSIVRGRPCDFLFRCRNLFGWDCWSLSNCVESFLLFFHVCIQFFQFILLVSLLEIVSDVKHNLCAHFHVTFFKILGDISSQVVSTTCDCLCRRHLTHLMFLPTWNF